MPKGIFYIPLLSLLSLVQNWKASVRYKRRMCFDYQFWAKSHRGTSKKISSTNKISQDTSLFKKKYQNLDIREKHLKNLSTIYACVNLDIKFITDN